MSGASQPAAPKRNASPRIDLATVRRDFPILQNEVNGKPLVYLDSAATSQKPQQVIDAITGYYETINANVHRGVHTLSVAATDAYEGAREKVRQFLGAGDITEVVFLRGTTEGVNLVAQTYGRANVKSGDEVVISAMEHHSNIVPWQMLCEEKGAVLRVAPMDEKGDLIVDEYSALLSDRTKIVALTHVANALGTVNPIARLIAIAHERGIPVLVDGAQAAPHIAIDVQKLDADFYTFSAHKAYGPTGIGALYVKNSILESMPPYQGGGDMIASVTFEKTTYNRLPHRFEAGTPNIAGAIGLGAAIDYITTAGISRIAAHENIVVQYAIDMLSEMRDVRLIGTPKHRAGVVSFVIEGVHPHDAGTIIDQEGVAIRAGHHCSQPVMDFYKVPATCRASFGIYNSRDDVDRLVAAIARVQEVFS